MTIQWTKGQPPAYLRDKRLLVLAEAMAAHDRRGVGPFIAHYGKAYDSWVPIYVPGMSSSDARPKLAVKYWAEIDLPEGVQIYPLPLSEAVG